jgi:hypothetical protein
MICAGRRPRSELESGTCFAPDQAERHKPPETYRLDAGYVINAAQWILQMYPAWSLTDIKRLPVRERLYWEKYVRAVMDRGK